MLWLHFLVGDRLPFDGKWEDHEKMDVAIRTHLGVEDRDRYAIHREPDEEDSAVIRICVEDRAVWDRYTSIETLPRMVSNEQPYRSVWINPPSEDQGEEQSYPWNTHYTEYIQVYHADFEEKNMYIIKYWKGIEEAEMRDSTPLARIRYDYLRSSKTQ